MLHLKLLSLGVAREAYLYARLATLAEAIHSASTLLLVRASPNLPFAYGR